MGHQKYIYFSTILQNIDLNRLTSNSSGNEIYEEFTRMEKSLAQFEFLLSEKDSSSNWLLEDFSALDINFGLTVNELRVRGHTDILDEKPHIELFMENIKMRKLFSNFV